MRNLPLVSIITITRNRADLIGRCIQSVALQTYKNHEHIILDGNSVDNTKELVNNFIKYDNRIKYKKLDKYGPALQMEEALRICKGKYITFLDDDDEYMPLKIEKQVNKFESLGNDYGLVYCWMTYYDMKSNKPLYTFSHELRGFVGPEAASIPCVSGTPTLMVKKDIIPLVGGIYKDKLGLIGADWEFAARVCQKYKVDFVPESLVKVYVNHNHQQLTNINRDTTIDNKIKFNRYFLYQFSDMFELKPYCSIPHHYELAGLYLKKKEFKLGILELKIVIEISPSFKTICKSLYVCLKNLLWILVHLRTNRK